MGVTRHKYPGLLQLDDLHRRSLIRFFLHIILLFWIKDAIDGEDTKKRAFHIGSPLFRRSKTAERTVHFGNKALLLQRFSVVGGRQAVHFLAQPLEGGQREATVIGNGLNGVVGMLPQQLFGQAHTLLVQIVLQVLAAALLLNDAAEGGTVDAHQVAEHFSAEVVLGIEPPLLHSAVEGGEAHGFAGSRGSCPPRFISGLATSIKTWFF